MEFPFGHQEAVIADLTLEVNAGQGLIWPLIHS